VAAREAEAAAAREAGLKEVSALPAQLRAAAAAAAGAAAAGGGEFF
jgi:hypothetical protein